MLRELDKYHYNDVMVSTMASKFTSVSIVYSTVCSGEDQRKYQSSASLAFVRGNPLVTDGFPSQRASNADNVSIWWRHHDHSCWYPDRLFRQDIDILMHKQDKRVLFFHGEGFQHNLRHLSVENDGNAYMFILGNKFNMTSVELNKALSVLVVQTRRIASHYPRNIKFRDMMWQNWINQGSYIKSVIMYPLFGAKCFQW